MIALDDGYYATDGRFVRDSAYRAIGRGLSERRPDYREEWNRRQKALTESAFQTIFARQLEGSHVLTEVFYPDASTGQWAETDVVILCDDALVVLEAKAGVGAMQSPATHFTSHVRAIKNLVVKAYEQNDRFFRYLASATEVPLYQKLNTALVEVARVSLSRYRLALPIGLTVESFSPFSAMCKELPELQPILGTHPFVSVSIDDLFVLSRFLPSTGALLHYLSVRQQIAGLKGARLFDEVDHLGAYIAKNRFDITLRSQLLESNRVAWDGFSAEIDAYFSRDRWKTESPPQQPFPLRLQQILDGLAVSRSPGWLAADGLIRDLDDKGRASLDQTLSMLTPSLREHPRRWFATSGSDVRTLFFWLYRDADVLVVDDAVQQAELSALATRRPDVQLVCAGVDANGTITAANARSVTAPTPAHPGYRSLYRQAETIKRRTVALPGLRKAEGVKAQQKMGRNDLCWCGNGKKFKHCHGR